jgi:hypothetical protein
MKVESFEAARRIGRKAFEGCRSRRGDLDHRLSAGGHPESNRTPGTKPLHPMSLLARAYRGDPFPPQKR